MSEDLSLEELYEKRKWIARQVDDFLFAVKPEDFSTSLPNTRAGSRLVLKLNDFEITMDIVKLLPEEKEKRTR